MFKHFRLLIFALFSSQLLAVSIGSIQEAFPEDLVLEGKSQDQEIMLCLHGFGMDKSIGHYVKKAELTEEHVVAFNFLDHGEQIYHNDPSKLAIGTLEEIRPIIERLHLYVSQLGCKKIHIYGFSLGGGAAINTLAILKTGRFCKELNLTAQEMQQIVKALEKGSIILDCPLKSLDEMVEEIDPFNPFLKQRAQIFAQNDMKPIDALVKLYPSDFHILLCFANPDWITSNRDDALFIQRLEEANCFGTNLIVTSKEHKPLRPQVIEGYKRLCNKNG